MKSVKVYDRLGNPMGGEVAGWVINEDQFWIEADAYLSRPVSAATSVRLMMFDGSYMEMS